MSPTLSFGRLSLSWARSVLGECGGRGLTGQVTVRADVRCTRGDESDPRQALELEIETHVQAGPGIHTREGNGN